LTARAGWQASTVAGFTGLAGAPRRRDGGKAEEHLGFEGLGDVGPGTMRRLDELYA
jgi:hypothetical protein